MSSTPSVDKAARRKRFEGVFAAIKDEMTGYLKTENMPEDAVEWFDRVSISFGAVSEQGCPLSAESREDRTNEDLESAVQHARWSVLRGIDEAARLKDCRQAQPWHVGRGHFGDSEGFGVDGRRVFPLGGTGLVCRARQSSIGLPSVG